MVDQAKYTGDHYPDGILHVACLTSSVPHARIVNIDTSKAKALKGVRAVLTGADVKDIYVGTRVKDQPVLAYDKVRMSGDAVAAVAADNEEIAEEAGTAFDRQRLLRRVTRIDCPLRMMRIWSSTLYAIAMARRTRTSLKGGISVRMVIALADCD